jgi:hypothetical protein
MPLGLTVVYFAFPEQLPLGPHGERDHCAETDGRRKPIAKTKKEDEGERRGCVGWCMYGRCGKHSIQLV